MEIVKGKIPSAKKCCVYGPEGIGKSTLASRFPEPLFIDTEGSTRDMDVSRTPTPSSWSMLIDQVRYVRDHSHICKTLVIDTADWAEMMCITHICDSNQKKSVEEFGYGKGYTYAQEEFGRLLNLLEEVVGAGIHVVLTAHAKMRKFEQPDEMGAYDRWEMKLSKGVAPMVKEWVDMVLFCNYKTMVINVDGQGAQKGKNKVQGGKRVMYTTHHSCWDAKNRYGLPDEIPFEYAAIAHIMEAPTTGQVKQEEPKETPKQEAVQTSVFTGPEQATGKSSEEPAKKTEAAPPVEVKQKSVGDYRPIGVDERIPKKLRDLMLANDVCEWDIQNVVAARGYFPADMEVYDYPEDFVNGVLVSAWDKVYAMIREMKEKESIPFK